MRFLTIALAVLSFATLGCGKRDAVFIERQAKPDSAPIEVLTEKPSRPYVEIGLTRIQAEPDDVGYVTDKLRQKARRMGGDAVIMRVVGTATDRGPVRTIDETITEGVVIAWK